MSAAELVKKVNLKKTESTEWEFEIEDGSNKVTGKVGYTDDFEQWLNRAPALKSTHPEIPALILKKISAKKQEGNIIAVTLHYENNSPNATYPGRSKGKIKRYHMEVGGGEEPLLTNEAFKDLSDAEREAATELLSSARRKEDYTKAKEVLKSAPGVKFIAKVRKGIEAYRNPSLVWVEKFSTDDLSDVELPNVYKTYNTLPGKDPGSGGDRNWLRLPPVVSPHDDGKTWDIENRWELSLVGKWDPDLYKAHT